MYYGVCDVVWWYILCNRQIIWGARMILETAVVVTSEFMNAQI